MHRQGPTARITSAPLVVWAVVMYDSGEAWMSRLEMILGTSRTSLHFKPPRNGL